MLNDYLMFFTNTGRVYVERVYGVPEGSRASKGRSIKNMLKTIENPRDLNAEQLDEENCWK